MRRTLLVVSMVFLSGCGPSDYDECILENMKGINDKTAAGLVMQSCMAKFPTEGVSVEKCPLRSMTKDELSLLEVNGRTGYRSDLLEFSVYNHNKVAELHELTVSLVAQNYKFPQEYTVSTFVRPRSADNSIGISVAETPISMGFAVVEGKTCSR